MGKFFGFKSTLSARFKAPASLITAALLVLIPLTPAHAAAVAGADTATPAYGASATIDVLANDTAADGQTLVPATLLLCGASESLDTCSQTSLTTSAGTFDTTTTSGQVTFTPATYFYGTAAAVSYAVADDAATPNYIEGTITVTGAAPTAIATVADSQAVAVNDTVTIDVLANDTSGEETTDLTSLAICANTVTVASNCTSAQVEEVNKGTFTANATGDVTFTPATDYVGALSSVKYVIKDAAGQYSNLATISVTVVGAPTATDDTTTTAFNTNKDVSPLSNDSAADNSVGVTLDNTTLALCDGTVAPDCVATTVTVDTVGVFSLSGTTVTFDPEVDYVGTATVDYQVKDTLGQVTSATISITVDAEVVVASATADTNSGDYNTEQANIDVVANDVQATGETFTASTVKLCLGTEAADVRCTQTSREIALVGTYNVNIDGTISFAPLDTFTGDNVIDYEVTDSANTTVRGTLTITVNLPTAGVSVDDTNIVKQNGTVTVSVLANDTAGGAATDVTSVKLCADVADLTCTETELIVAGEGTYTVNADGTVDFVAETDVADLESVVTYEAFDITGQSTGLATITVGIIAPPTAVDDISSDAVDTAQSVFPILNDTYSDLAVTYDVAFVASSLKLCGVDPAQSAPACDKTSLALTEGDLAIADGEVTFTPDAAFTGDLVVTYQVADELGQVTSANITFSVIAAAVATDDESSDDYNVEQLVDVLANDSPTTGQAFDITQLFLCDSTEAGEPCSLTSVEVTDKGTFDVTETGEINFTPLATFAGTVSIDYEITDDLPATVGATLTVTVATPDAPSLTADENSDEFDINQTVDVLLNDTGFIADLDPTSVKLCLDVAEAAADCDRTSLIVPGVGAYSVDAETGAISFNPSFTFWGDATVAYTVADILGQLAVPATVVFTVAEPAAESVNNDFSAGPADTVQTIDVLANDRPGDSAFVIASLKLCSDAQLEASACNLTSYTATGEGVYRVTATGKITFTPDAAFEGEATKPARYTVGVTDGTRFGIATVQVAVVDAPLAVEDTNTDGYDQNQSVDVSANDTLSDLALQYEVAFDLSSIRLCGVGQEAPDCNYTKLIVPSVGIFTVDVETGEIRFNPSATFAGDADAVTYQISDTLGQATSSTLNVTVESPNPATLVDDESFAKMGAKQVIRVLDNDVRGGAYLNPAKVRLCDEGEGDELACSLTSLVVDGEGTYTVNTDGTVAFVPLAATRGVMTVVTYQVADVTGQVETPAEIAVTVVGKVVVVNDTATVAYNVNAEKNVLSNDTLRAEAIANEVTIKANSVRLCLTTDVAPKCTGLELKVSRQGTYTVNATTGVITFNPLSTFAGVATAVTYSVKDSLGQASSGTLTVTVGSPTAATITNDTSWAKMGAVQKVTVTSNDVAGGAALVAKSVRLCATAEITAATCSKTSLTVTDQGTYTVNTTTGQVTFTPLSKFFGVATAVRYSVADLTGQRSAIATLTVSVVGKPMPVADTASAGYKEVAEFDPTDNDGVSALATSKSVTLKASTIRLCASGQRAPNCDATSVVIAGEGTFRLNTTTKLVTFTPLATFAGETSTLKYQVKDSLGQAQTATLVATIEYPEPSILVDDTAVAGVAIAKKINVVANDLSLGAPIDKPSVKLCSANALTADECVLNTLVVADEGAYTVNTSTGVITFKSVAEFSGEASPVSYTVADITGQRASMAAISVTVVDGPILTADDATDAYDITQTIAVLENDELSDLEVANSIEIRVDSLRICAVGKSAPNCALTTLTVAGEGTYTVNKIDGEITFNPLTTFAGETKPVTYQVKDDLGNVADSTVIFTVESPTLGVLSNDTENVVQSVKATINVLLNDTKGEAPYKVSTVRLCASNELTGASCSLTTLTVAGEGTYKVDTATGKISFTSAATFTGLATFVRYSVADITGQHSVPARLTLTVNAVL